MKVIVALLAFATLASADAIKLKPTGGVCPSIGAARTCDWQIFLTPKGTVVPLRTSEPAVNATDGDESYLIVNDSGQTVTSFTFFGVAPGDEALCADCTFTVIGDNVVVTFLVPLTSNRPGDFTWVTFSNFVSVKPPPPPPTPEPSTMVLAITGLVGLALARRMMRLRSP